MDNFNLTTTQYSELASFLESTTDTQVNDMIQSVISEGIVFPEVPHIFPPSYCDANLYNFSISFPNQDSNAKKVTWTYSTVLNKVYVKRESPCPVYFATNVPMDRFTVIRATAFYASPEHSPKPVRRCYEHQMLDQGSKNEHFIQSEAAGAIYENDANDRKSVIVPFENSPIGQTFSTYVFSFACYNSCAGGPNRRDVNVVFTLERNNQVLGRCTVGLRVCAAPGRDRSLEEKPKERKESTSSKENESPERKMEDSVSIMPSITEMENNCERLFTQRYRLQVEDYNKYKYLRVMRRFQKIQRFLKEHPDKKNDLFKYISSSEESC